MVIALVTQGFGQQIAAAKLIWGNHWRSLREAKFDGFSNVVNYTGNKYSCQCGELQWRYDLRPVASEPCGMYFILKEAKWSFMRSHSDG